MKKLTLVILAAALAISFAHAGWWKTYGDDGGEHAHCVQVISDGNYIISGEKNDSLWLLKVDTLGNTLWTRVYNREPGNWIKETKDGGFIVSCGWGLLKVDSSGDSLWAYDYGIRSYCVDETSDGGYVVCGSSGSVEDILYFTLARIDQSGNTIWVKSYGQLPMNVNIGRFIRVVPEGGFISTGQTGLIDNENTLVSLWILRTNDLGDTLWTKKYGGEDGGYSYDLGHCIQPTTDRGFVICGRGNNRLWLLKTDSLGDTIWTRSYDAEEGYCVQETVDDCYVVTGKGGLTQQRYPLPLGYLWLLKSDYEGNSLWVRTYGGGNSEVGRCVNQTGDKGFIVTGYASSFGQGNLYLLKTDSLGHLAINEFDPRKNNGEWGIVSCIGSQVLIKYANNPKGFRATIFDASGCIVDNIVTTSQSGTIAWGGRHSSGVYFIKSEFNTFGKNTIKVIIVK